MNKKRPIKFRGKLEGVWFYFEFEPGLWQVWPPFDEKTVGEYIGIKDRQGNEIFEGDIVKTSRNFKAVVEYNKGAFWFNGYRFYPSDGSGLQSKVWSVQNGHRWEVIGNIHDDHELLASARA